MTAPFDVSLSPELAELTGMIGGARVVHLLQRFLPELDVCTHALDAAVDVSASAHRMTAQAGFLGFHALSSLARDVEHGLASPDSLRAEIAAVHGQVRDLVAYLSKPA